MKSYIAALSIVAALSFCHFVSAQTLLEPLSVSSTGSINNDASLIIDSSIPNRGESAGSPENVFWNGAATPDRFLLIDYGQVVSISDVLIAGDNNDSYRVEYSIDGVNFTTAFEFLSADGNANFGIDILTTISSFPLSTTDPATATFVSRDFVDIDARFLRLSSFGGNFNTRAIGEFQAFTTVPLSPVLGDVNLDGDVNFLDIAPFIAILSSGGSQAQADVDQNGEVNFLDIAPFIGILANQ